MMKNAIRIFTVLCVFAAAQMAAYAQSALTRSQVDSIATSLQAQPEKRIVDSTLVGMDIFEIMPLQKKDVEGGVLVRQSSEVRQALMEKIRNASFTSVSGYRIRIFFSNEQDARQASVLAAQRFMEKFGTHSVYHNYTYPNFKVTVGDFRTKSEALELLSAVKRDFPSAFVVKENIVINY